MRVQHAVLQFCRPHFLGSACAYLSRCRECTADRKVHSEQRFERGFHVDWRRWSGLQYHHQVSELSHSPRIYSPSVSYLNVFKTKYAHGQNPVRPLLHLIPFPITAAIQIFWLSSPDFSRSALINSPLFVPFLCAWGLQFAHQVGRMILAHVTKQPFPGGDALWLLSVVGAIDANMPRLFNRYVFRVTYGISTH